MIDPHHYRRFKVDERVLLTGHSHQAWPDVAEEGVLAAFADAAELVDDKWGRAFVQAELVKAGFARLLGSQASELTLTSNTHEAGLRFLSALDLARRPRLVTTDGEFHSLRRQLARLEEEGIVVVRVPATPVDSLAERLAAAVDDRCAAVLVSSVMFQSARIVPNLPLVMAACTRVGVELLVDAYHHLGIVPFSLAGLERAFITGGGYKYCQLGEGNCFLRVPPGCTLRPVITGWYAEFSLLAGHHDDGVPYPEGAARFAGATYDPTSHYRGARVFRFFADHGLDIATLRATSQRQIRRLADGFDRLALDRAVIDRDRWDPNDSLDGIGGFLALRTPHAARVTAGLRARHVHVDARGDIVRFGPAPYVSDRQLDEAMHALDEVVRELTRPS